MCLRKVQNGHVHASVRVCDILLVVIYRGFLSLSQPRRVSDMQIKRVPHGVIYI